MNDLEDHLDLRHHRGIKPDVYYRCPTLESMDGAIRNELQKSSMSIVPVEVATEFVFGADSTITIPVPLQTQLDALGFVPADMPQSITVEHSLCHSLEGKERLRTQRAIARAFIDVMQHADGFRYVERQAWVNSDGTRFKYVCSDSLQNRDRKRNTAKKDIATEDDEDDVESKKRKRTGLPTFDCKGAIHVKFSAKRDGVNVIYIHNPIHRDVQSRLEIEKENAPFSTVENISVVKATEPADMAKPGKKKKGKVQKSQITVSSGDHHATAPQAGPASPKKRKKNAKPSSPETSRSSKSQAKRKKPNSRSKAVAVEQVPVLEPEPKPEPELALPPAKEIKGKACIRCREKKIKCDEAKPTCNQCRRGLWTCQYAVKGPLKRSKNGCMNCRQRRRKCTEEKPSCAYCLKVDDDCEYP